MIMFFGVRNNSLVRWNNTYRNLMAEKSTQSWPNIFADLRPFSDTDYNPRKCWTDGTSHNIYYHTALTY